MQVILQLCFLLERYGLIVVDAAFLLAKFWLSEGLHRVLNSMIAVLILLQVFQENLLILIFHQYLQQLLNHQSKEALVGLIFIDGFIQKFLDSFFCFEDDIEDISLGGFDHVAKIFTCKLLRSWPQQPFHWDVDKIVKNKHL